MSRSHWEEAVDECREPGAQTLLTQGLRFENLISDRRLLQEMHRGEGRVSDSGNNEFSIVHFVCL